MTMDPIRLLVVDDHSLFRQGLINILMNMPEFIIVGEAANGVEALKMLEKTEVDVMLMDINMPQMDGIETIAEIRERGYKLPVFMLTISKSDKDLFKAIKAGADGYILKNIEPEDLKLAILRGYNGQGFLSPEMTSSVLNVISKGKNQYQKSPLTERELQILNYLRKGWTTADISSELVISENTVKTHIRHILEKLNASNRTEAVSIAIQNGIIS
ncbi:MAG: response regulator transcription factor [Anaerolineaceae bacterium]|nr:response regulator transcription factor [Anaerolineaceae bacterium]